MWQDPVIAGIIVGFTLTTIPLIRHRVRVPFATSIPMVVGSLGLVYVYSTMNLWFSCGIECVSFALWVEVMFQKVFNVDRY